MNLREHLYISPEVSSALRAGKPVVALESTLFSHDVPCPESTAFAAEMERAVRAEGTVPAIVAIVDGVLTVGAPAAHLARLCSGEVPKASRRDLPVLAATKGTGATTTAATMILACLAGIRVLATGGIGGVHRGTPHGMDVSADLQELRQTPVGVVCAGVPPFLDAALTLEYLETMGVPVLGLRTECFPAVFCAESGCKVDYCAADETEAARILKTKWDLGLKGGVLLASPVPAACAMPAAQIQAAVETALAAAEQAGIRGSSLTPFLLSHIAHETKGASLAAGRQCACANARAAARLAAAYARLS